MVSTFTTNIGLEEPARGDQVGTWDTPVNNNTTLVDLVAGGVTTIALAGANVVLNSAQYSCKTIIFSSTLTASVTITFPTSFKKSYEIIHTCTGSSAFIITLQTSVVGGNNICAKPGDPFDCLNDGASIRFKNMGPIGTYWDYAGSSVPRWITACAINPYLPCDGTTFSSASYPQLAIILGSTTLPDMRGRVRAQLNGGTGRMTTAGGGVDGNTNKSAGGVDSLSLTAAQLAAHTHVNTLTDPGHFHFEEYGFDGTGGGAGIAIPVGAFQLNQRTGVATTGVTITNASAGSGSAHQNVQPCIISGITMIRSG